MRPSFRDRILCAGGDPAVYLPWFLNGDRASIRNGRDPTLPYTLKEATTIGDCNREREGIKMAVQTIGMDVDKHVCQLHGVDAHGRVVLRKKLSRATL
jgi:hypothetical protein